MSDELRQSVMIVARGNWGVVTATLATVSSAVVNFFEAIQPVVGGLTGCLALFITYILFKKRDKLLEKEIELREAQIKAISERKEARG